MATETISGLFDVLGAIPAYASGDQLLMRDVSDPTGDPQGTAVKGTVSGLKTSVSTSMTISGSSEVSSGAFYQYYSWGGGTSYGGLVVANDQHFAWQDNNSNPIGSGTKDTRFTRVAAGIIGIRAGSSSLGGCLEFVEQTAPSAPAANGCRLFLQDNGAGKTQLMALFATGAAQQVAIEP